MSVIIRLQNLPWSANALDIRQYFQGLSIPEGGVHIVGGEQGDAFIAFSTDEDARQAFNRNNGKIKEVQINLNLSSRTEMQRVIEAARAQSYAAFMQPNPTPLPAIVPAAVPSAVPDVKKEEGKRDSRKRSRSRSRERKDRSRDRDRNRRHRDRSRSRDRRDRRRKDRSRSRGRSRSKERDRRNNSRDNKRMDNNRNTNRDNNKPKPQVWSNQIPNNDNMALSNIQQGLLGTFPINLEETAHNLNMLNNGMGANGLFNNFHNNNRGRDSWPPNFQQQNQPGNFQNFNNNFHHGNNLRGQMQNNFGNRAPYQRNNDHYDQYEDNAPIDQNSCIQLESFFGGYSDVRRFFQGIFISNKGIKFINDETGQRTGVVYVQFGHHQGKLEALRKNGEVLSGSKVQVSHLEDNIFDNAVDRYIPQEDYYNENGDDTKNMRSKFKLNRISRFESIDVVKDFTCLLVDDLPTYVKEQDILHMFSAHPLFSLILTNKPRGGHVAYVKFSNKEVAKMAYEEQSHHVVNGKQVTVLPLSDEDFDKISKEHDPNLEESTTTKTTTTTNIGTDCLSISRLPMKTKDKDIADFFSDIGIIPSKIHLMSNPMGAFTGQAYCVFETIKDASLAAEKDDTMFGNVPISVKPIMHSEMQSILNNLTHTPQSAGDNRSSMMQNLHGAPMMQQQHPPNRPFFNRNFDGGRGPPPPRFGGHRGGGMGGPVGPPRHRFGGNGGFQHMNNMNNGPMMDEAPPGCTVFMDNVPYKAGTNEILDFFDGYDISNNVSRRYNPNNTPSAEAKVIFNSAEEAFRAVKEKNGDKIWDRPIYLTQA